MTTELTIVEDIRAVTTFDQEKVNDYLKKLREHETSIIGDISTEQGRKEIASRAYAIAKAKNDIDRAAEALKAEAAKKVKAVNTERNRIWSEMESIQAEVRAPLTEWEEANEARVAALQEKINWIVSSVQLEGQPTTDQIKARLDGIDFKDTDWQEFKIRADIEIKKATDVLTARWEASKKYDAEQVELAELRRKQAEREQKERDDRIASEAAEKARKEAEEKARLEAQQAADKAKAEQDRIEAERVAADQRAKIEAERAQEAEYALIAAISQSYHSVIKAAEKAAADLKAAEEKAESDRILAESDTKRREEAAAQRVRDEADAKAKAEAKATAEREADKAHRAKINNRIHQQISAVIANAGSEDVVKAIIIALAKKEIDYVSINY